MNSRLRRMVLLGFVLLFLGTLGSVYVVTGQLPALPFNTSAALDATRVAPTIIPNSKYAPSSVELTVPPATTVRYTTDGTTPTCSSGRVYRNPFGIFRATTVR